MVEWVCFTCPLPDYSLLRPQKYNYDRRICTNQGALNLLKLKTFLSLMDDEREVSN